MRQLRYLRQAGDGEHLVLETTDGLEQFQLALDATLRDAVRPEARAGQPRASVALGNHEPKIGPRDIQMRVRAGESPQQIADSFGAQVDWVMRFAGPVLDERARVADEARRARARRSTTDGQPVIFGEAVDERYAAHGIEPDSVRWDARRRDDGQWIISAHWHGGDADRVAEWTFQLSPRAPWRHWTTRLPTCSATGRSARSPRWHRHRRCRCRRRRRSLPASSPSLPWPTRRPAPCPSSRRSSTRRVFDDATCGDADRGPSSTRSQPFRCTSGTPRAGTPHKAKRAVTDLGIARRGAESEEEKAARARVPSWDDILLGVRRKQRLTPAGARRNSVAVVTART